MHSHVGYNMLPLWSDPDRDTPYLNHDGWPGPGSYQEAISWPAFTLVSRAPESVLAYVQVRALAGGTTSIQGWPGVSRPPMNALVRCIDDDQVGDLADPISVSALTLEVPDLTDRAGKLRDGRVFIYHCSEGQPASIVTREFDDLGTAGCLQAGLVAIHCSALNETHFDRWRRDAAVHRGPVGTVVWSPFSNLWLYGTTTDVPAAREHRLAVSLGTDWGPSGTKNLLGEVKVARLWSDLQGWDLSDADLVRMMTTTPGDALKRAWGLPAGRLVTGGLGDAVVVARLETDPWTNLVRARESDVMLVVVGGQARYGPGTLMEAAGAPPTTAVRIGATWRRVPLTRPDDPTELWTWSDVIARIDAVREDAATNPPSGPAGAMGLGGPPPAVPSLAGDPPGTPPLAASLDMPGAPAQAAGPPPQGVTVDIPAAGRLYHDRDWLATIPGRGFHGGVLDGLAEFF
jgi:hypothetical protein